MSARLWRNQQSHSLHHQNYWGSRNTTEVKKLVVRHSNALRKIFLDENKGALLVDASNVSGCNTDAFHLVLINTYRIVRTALHWFFPWGHHTRRPIGQAMFAASIPLIRELVNSKAKQVCMMLLLLVTSERACQLVVDIKWFLACRQRRTPPIGCFQCQMEQDT